MNENNRTCAKDSPPGEKKLKKDMSPTGNTRNTPDLILEKTDILLPAEIYLS